MPLPAKIECCCGGAGGPCCLCDAAWTYTSWSVSILGKTFTGTFVPIEKPDPFTVENGCNVRNSDNCIIDNPVVLLDCVQESDWTASIPVDMNTGQNQYNICYVYCPQCSCEEAPPT